MEKEKNNHVWGFDIGKGSLGEAVRIGGDFKHIASVLLDPEFGEIKTAALARRQMRTRKAHKAREKWLEECLEGTGVEILKRRDVGIVDGQWQLISKGDERLEREFPPSGEDVCYNSIALRCKLLLGEKLEGWQVFKALNSAIQKRGYDENIPWGEAEEKSSKKDDDDYAQKLSQYEKEKSELFESFADGEKYDFPCFFKAYKMGLWSPENPTRVEVRIDCRAQKAKSYVIARKYVEREFECLVEAAAKFFPKLKGRAKFILYGVSETPYASYYGNMRKKFGLKRGAESDWTALGQKVPRFDNRIIDKCRLIPRMNVCKIRPLNEARNEKDLLYYEVTLALKLLNLRFFRNSNIEQLTFEEFKKAFEIAAGAKYKMTKTAMKKFLKSISATALGDDYAEIEPPKESGRASFSRPAMEILKELIFSGMPPREFYGRKISEISNTDKNKGVVSSDLDFIKLMGDCPWIAGIETPTVPILLKDATSITVEAFDATLIYPGGATATPYKKDFIKTLNASNVNQFYTVYLIRAAATRTPSMQIVSIKNDITFTTTFPALDSRLIISSGQNETDTITDTTNPNITDWRQWISSGRYYNVQDAQVDIVYPLTFFKKTVKTTLPR